MLFDALEDGKKQGSKVVHPSAPRAGCGPSRRARVGGVSVLALEPVALRQSIVSMWSNKRGPVDLQRRLMPGAVHFPGLSAHLNQVRDENLSGVWR